jgi:hypothetical protein
MAAFTNAMTLRDPNTPPPDEKLMRRLDQARNVAPLDTDSQTQGVPNPQASMADLEKEDPEACAALKTILTKCARQIIVARRMQIYRAGRSELYYLGKQKIFWNGSQQEWNGVGPNGSIVSAESYEAESFDFVTNFYKGYAESFMTTAAQNVPGVPFHPEDPNRREDIESAKHATSASELVSRWNNAPMLCSKLAYHGFTGGLMATYVREVTDGSQFGYEVDPQTGQLTNVPKSRPVISIHGALDVSVPMWADSQSDMDYLCLFTDIPKSKAHATYPWLQGKIPSVSDMRDDDVLARLFRAAVRGNIAPVMPSDAMEDITTVLRMWMRPSCFWYIDDENIRGRLLQRFPQGALVHWVGARFAAAANENMDDHWSVESATEGRGMARPGIGEPFVDVQDQINILSNLFHEYLVFGIPPIFHDAKAINKAAVQQMTAKVSQFVPVNFRDQLAAIGDLFWQPQAAQVPEALISRLDALAGPIGQFLTGIFPALVGAQAEGVADKTASGYKMQLQQSMGRVAFFYRRLKSVYEKTMYNAVREFANNRNKDITLSTQDPTKKPQAINPIAIRKGNFNVYAEADDGYPTLFSDEQSVVEKFIAMAEKNPMLAADLEEPANQAYIKNVYGMTDWVVAGEDSRLKQLKEIEMMLAPGVGPEPMKDPNEPDPTKAAVVGMQSSVPIKPLDHDDMEFATCRQWANSDAGMDAAENNPEGYENVILHAQEHQQRMQALAAQNSPPAKVSINVPLDKMPPEAIAQELEKQGIHLSPQDFQVQHAMQKDLKATAPPKPDPKDQKDKKQGEQQ